MLADPLFTDRPGLFPVQLPPIDDRRAIQIGERVKVLLGVREAEQRLRGRWLLVESHLPSYAAQRFLGVDPEDPKTMCEFGPEHVYRIEPRLFTVWGCDGQPIAVRGQASSDPALHAPLDHDDRLLSRCGEVILRYRANGYEHARTVYQELARHHPAWPQWHDLT